MIKFTVCHNLLKTWHIKLGQLLKCQHLFIYTSCIRFEFNIFCYTLREAFVCCDCPWHIHYAKAFISCSYKYIKTCLKYLWLGHDKLIPGIWIDKSQILFRYTILSTSLYQVALNDYPLFTKLKLTKDFKENKLWTIEKKIAKKYETSLKPWFPFY